MDYRGMLVEAVISDRWCKVIAYVHTIVAKEQQYSCSIAHFSVFVL